MASGAFTEPDMAANFPNYSGGPGFSYVAIASGYLIPIGNDILTYDFEPSSDLAFDFGPGIKAFGGYFYNTNLDLNFVGGPFTISLNDGAFVTAEESTSSTTFYGFISDNDLLNATIRVVSSPADIEASNESYATAGTVIVGVPSGAPASVPGPVPLLGVAAAFRASRRLRARCSARRSRA